MQEPTGCLYSDSNSLVLGSILLVGSGTVEILSQGPTTRSSGISTALGFVTPLFGLSREIEFFLIRKSVTAGSLIRLDIADNRSHYEQHNRQY